MSDHPQLTAYLLGELSPEESAALEAQLAETPELQLELASLRQTVTALQSAFAQHIDTQPAVPAIDRDKLHTLLRSAIGQATLPVSSDSSATRIVADNIVCPTGVAAPVLLAASPSLPSHGPSRHGWLVAGTMLAVGGLFALSLLETGRPLAVVAQNGRGTNLHLAIEDQGAVSNTLAKLTEKPLPQLIAGTSSPQGINESLFSLDTWEASRGLGRDAVDGYSTPSPVVGLAFDTPPPPAVNFQRRYLTVPKFATPTDRLQYDGQKNSGFSAMQPLSRELSASFFGRVVSGDHPESRAKLRAAALSDHKGITRETLLLAEADFDSGVDYRKADTQWISSGTALMGEERFGTRVYPVGDLVLPVTPRIIVEQEGEPGLGVDDYSHRYRVQLQDGETPQKAELSTLTFGDYENGIDQLDGAVKSWIEFTEQSGDALARSELVIESKAPVDTIQDLEKVLAEQSVELKKLRDTTPDIVGKPLVETHPEAAKNAELALVRVSRELARQQQVWYYREGYIRDLEATIAAAEQYAHVPENDFVTPEAQPLSTFGVDVDTASYSNVRRFVESGQLPPPDAVRIEELVNSFQYDGPKVEGEHPLAVAAEVSACPWQPQHQLLRVVLKGKSIDLQQRPPARLVFLVDTSGSMSDENKLPLVKQSLRILVEQMREQDRLSIVTYSDNAGLLLDSTGGDKREAILAAIEGLHSDGSTNGEAGLKLAYEVAVKQFGEGATNRVMLCTDGDFNVGESADSELVKLIEKQRQTGVFLNIFGFGSGNLKDAKLEAIADKGNGQYIYIDGIKEARKTLLNELTGTLYTIAKDVKLQIEFNPNLVGSYRLVGYENRAMAAKDFSNDKVDSGDMGAGHSVVALYEIVPPGAPQPVAPQPQVEPLKYKRAGSVSARSENVAAADASTLTPNPSPGGRGEPEGNGLGGQETPEGAPAVAEAPKPADPLATELCTIRVRYKQPTSNESTKIEAAVRDPRLLFGKNPPISRDHIWATAVAQFGLLARHSTFVGTGNYSQVLELAQSAIGDDPTGQRREFVTLVRQTQSLSFERERQLAELSRRAEEHRRVIEEIKTVEKAPDVMTKASCSGKYRTLLRRIEVADDQPQYGEFKDYGRWDGAAYKTYQNLPHGYWVYVAPHWYIWGESTEQAAVDTTK